MKKLYIPLLVSLFLSTSCVTFFSRKNQPVLVKSTTEGANIYYKNKKEGQNAAALNWHKAQKVQQVVVKKEGYLDKTHAQVVTKKNPLRWANVIMAPTLYLGYYVAVIDAANNKCFQYPKIVTVPALTKAPAKRLENQKYLYLNTASINVTSKDTASVIFQNEKRYQSKKSLRTSNWDNKINYENTVFSDDLRSLLKRYNYVDTTKSIFPNFANTLYLNSNIKKLHFVEIQPKSHDLASTSNSMVQAVIEIEWELLDFYEVKLKTYKFRTKSDFYAYNVSEIEKEKDNDSIKTVFRQMIQNSMEKSLVELLKDPTLQTQLTKQPTVASDADNSIITLQKPVIASASLNKLIKSAVTVKTKNGHGSGILISEDGYLVTNYHVVANNESDLEIILNDGSKHKGKLVRIAYDADLALVKIEKSGLAPMLLNPLKSESEIGATVSALGTPRSIELGQSVAKGIISGIRNANSIDYIQTDVSINSGNSGGALLDENGTVIGVVTSKLSGFGVEGIGFAIPTHLVFEKLKIQYQN